MKISRFQLRLTMAFVLFIAVPILAVEVISVKLIGYGMALRSGPAVEAPLEDALQLLRSTIVEMKEEALLVASQIGSGSRAEGADGWRLARTPNDSVLALIPGHSRESFLGALSSGRAVSFQSGGRVYGLSPLATDRSSLVAVSKQIHPEVLVVADEVAFALKGYRKLASMESDLAKLIGLVSLAGGLALLLGAILAAAAFAKSVTTPIRRLVEGAGEVAKGNLDLRIEPAPKDEIGELVRAFNAMAAELKSGREELVRAERIAAWRDVARTLAHEIKNPLTPIQLSLRRLRKRLTGIEAQDKGTSESLEIIDRQLDVLRDLASEFSNFARAPKLEPKPVNPNSIVSEIISFYRSSTGNVSFVEELEHDIGPILADPGQLGRAFGNIVKNAVDAMPDGGKLCASTTLEGNWVKVEFRDNGSGIPEDALSRVFDPYFTTKGRGTGLGLAIVQQIVESHGGSIHIQSEPGKGTQVTLKLPVAGG